MNQNLNHFELMLQRWIEIFQSFSVKLISALLILIVGVLLIRIAKNVFRKIIEKRDVDTTVSGFLINMITWLLKLSLFIAIISKLGIETSSFVAVLGAMGLAIGMSLQGSLSNFTGGLLIIMFKPFRVGDNIQAQGISGTVKSIQIFNTQINTANNQAVFIPNGILSNGTIINNSREEVRRTEIQITISNQNDVNYICTEIGNILKNNVLILEQPEPTVELTEINQDTITISVRPWSNQSELQQMRRTLLLDLNQFLSTTPIVFPAQSIEIINREH
ncbi:MAG: mechanosensitive ion channel [Bacteroidota bacterium]|nr:mechanosensitive ion channel [Bacteroidota bacterium]